MTVKINEIENKLSQYISEVQKEKTSVEKYLAQLISKKDKAGYDELIDLDQEISEFKSIISDTKKLHDDLVHQYHHVSSRHLDEGVDFDVEKQEQLSSKDELESDYIYKLLHKNVSHAHVLDEPQINRKSAHHERILSLGGDSCRLVEENGRCEYKSRPILQTKIWRKFYCFKKIL